MAACAGHRRKPLRYLMIPAPVAQLDRASDFGYQNLAGLLVGCDLEGASLSGARFPNTSCLSCDGEFEGKREAGYLFDAALPLLI